MSACLCAAVNAMMCQLATLLVHLTYERLALLLSHASASPRKREMLALYLGGWLLTLHRQA